MAPSSCTIDHSASLIGFLLPSTSLLPLSCFHSHASLLSSRDASSAACRRILFLLLACFCFFVPRPFHPTSPSFPLLAADPLRFFFYLVRPHRPDLARLYLAALSPSPQGQSSSSSDLTPTPTMSSFITVEKRHLEYLLQKAGADTSKQADSVTISNSEYKQLLQDADHFKKLKESLLDGGLSQETLNVLISSPSEPTQNPSKSTGSRAEIASCVDRHYGNGRGNYKLARKYDDDEDDEDEDDDDEVLLASQHSDERDDYDESSRSTTESYSPPTVRRTIHIRGLPDRVTHRDIVQVMRGGPLLHIYLRARERNANVSFVEESDAQEFLRHAKTHGLYVAGRRVEVTWNDRQFYLPPYVRSKIDNGASRNLVIYKANPNITEAMVRNDLDHIHNLIVVTVSFKDGNVYISTNSVHNALFARSCMMSRLTYKGMKIAFYPDECASPLTTKGPIGLKKAPQAPSTKQAAIPNRFQLLSLDGAEEDGSDPDDDEMKGLPLNTAAYWTENSVSA